MHPLSQHYSRLQIGLFALLAASAYGCRRTPEPEPSPAPAPAAAALKPAEPAAQADRPAPAEPPPPAAPVEPAEPTGPTDDTPGWSRLRLEDSVPLCVFADNRERAAARSIELVKKQTLREDAPVTFGVFGPGCLNKACDDKPLLQCWADREGDTITVHSRYSSLHKDSSTCTKDCVPVGASCDSPALAAGKYTVQYGDKTYKLQIPSLVRKPCLNE
jgi:hypothetical protein